MSVGKGLLLGAANVLVIAIGIGAMSHDAGVTALVVMFGGIPGVLAGGVIGYLAGLFAGLPPAVRIAIIGAPAMGVVFLLAEAFWISDPALVACIPTAVATLVLERWTRRRVVPPVPVAIVRSMSA